MTKTQYNEYQLPRVCGDIERANEIIWRLKKTTVITMEPNHWLYYNSSIGLVHVMAIDWTTSIGGVEKTNFLSQAIKSGGRAYIFRRSYTPHHQGPGQRVELHSWATLEMVWNEQSNRLTTGYGSCAFVDWAEHEPATVWEHQDWTDLMPDLLEFFRADRWRHLHALAERG